jgi:hypothetical protein
MEKHEHLSFVLKREIVQRLARFDTPGQVVKAMKADHGIDLSPPRVQFYDPTSKNGAALSEELKTLFFETRKKFLEDLESIPIANKAVRLRRLDRMATAAEERGNLVLAADLGERAAKEVGGAYTNKLEHKHTGKVEGGGTHTAVVMTTDDPVEAAKIYQSLVNGDR